MAYLLGFSQKIKISKLIFDALLWTSGAEFHPGTEVS
jgi:hypothetical protein